MKNKKFESIPIFKKKDILDSNKLNKALKYIKRKGYVADSIEDIKSAIESKACYRLLDIDYVKLGFICDDNEGKTFKYFLPKKKVQWFLTNPDENLKEESRVESRVESKGDSRGDFRVDSEEPKKESKDQTETNEEDTSEDFYTEIELHAWCSITASKLKGMDPQNLSQYIGHKAFVGDSLEDLKNAIKQGYLISLGNKELEDKIFIPLELATANGHKVYEIRHRPFQNMDEFLRTVCDNNPDTWITMKRMDNGYPSTNLTVWHRRLQEYSETCNQVIFGVQHNFSFSEMFNKWKFLKNNIWNPFGIKYKFYLWEMLGKFPND